MSLESTSAQEFLERFESPPSTSESTDALNNELLVLRDSELGPRLDRAMREGEDIRYLYQAMQDAVWMKRETLVKELLRCKMPISSTYVQTAAEAKAKNILTIFFDNGWDINTPLDELTPPVLASALEDREMTEWLLDRGADPNMRCELDYTPLTHAVQMFDVPTVDHLLDRGGDVNKGELVYWAIGRYREENLEMVKFLIDRGAPFNALLHENHEHSRRLFPHYTRTPLHLAVSSKKHNVIRYLIQKGASVDIKDYKDKTAVECADEDTRKIIMAEIQKRSQ